VRVGDLIPKKELSPEAKGIFRKERADHPLTEEDYNTWKALPRFGRGSTYPYCFAKKEERGGGKLRVGRATSMKLLKEK